MLNCFGNYEALTMEKEIRVEKPWLVFSIIAITTFILGSAVDVFVPSLPHIAIFFHASAAETRLSVTVYLIAYGIFQLFYGSISDHYGRRKVLIFGLIGYSFSSYLITLSTSVQIFLVLRFFQGMFTGGVGVVNRAVLTDSYSGKMLSKYASYILIAWASGPIISPFIGGYLQEFFGWKSCFYFLTIYTIISVLLVIFFLPETCRNCTKISLKQLFKNYQEVFSSRVFVSGALICGMIYGFITVYNVVGPFLVETELKYGPIVYGHIALVLGLAWTTGIMIFRYRLARSKITTITNSFLMSALVISILWIVSGSFLPMNLATATVPAVLLFICGGVIFTDTFAKTLGIFPHAAGIASAALGSMFSIVSGVCSGVAGLLTSHSLMPVSVTFLVLTLLSFMFFKGVLSRAK